METQSIIALNTLEHGRCRPWPFLQDFCLTCGICAGACPASGVDGFDPRKLVRMISLGMEDETVSERWPWICTMCGKCANLCPMEIDIPGLVRKIRSRRRREEVPGILHKGLEAALETGNNLRLPKDDYVFILEDVAEEIAAEPGFEGFTVPIDKTGARILTTIHNKLVNTHTEDLKHWWKIFHAAGEDWTVPSENWEGTNWGYFTGDDAAMKTLTGRIAEHMERLEIDTLLWPE
ncbi:MAG: 4Fe-4S dicluster domain-containing protein [Deltaproteobacteria bacterium]|nr:4Fe-4S dicluster domain-containing protein [Deltaproteobacteria bacterium]MBW1955896.1 4Fe-4S dicluster domain-containing protein [Deltaproteobacteria bacterium]